MSSAIVDARTASTAGANEGKTVLIVDDDAVFCATLADGIVSLTPGLAALTAENGNQAITILQNFAIDLVITDLRMPGMDGRELTNWINVLRPRTPVIVISAYADPPTIRALSTKRNYFFDKPVDFRELRRTVDALIN